VPPVGAPSPTDAEGRRGCDRCAPARRRRDRRLPRRPVRRHGRRSAGPSGTAALRLVQAFPGGTSRSPATEGRAGAGPPTSWRRSATRPDRRHRRSPCGSPCERGPPTWCCSTSRGRQPCSSSVRGSPPHTGSSARSRQRSSGRGVSGPARAPDPHGRARCGGRRGLRSGDRRAARRGDDRGVPAQHLAAGGARLGTAGGRRPACALRRSGGRVRAPAGRPARAAVPTDPIPASPSPSAPSTGRRSGPPRRLLHGRAGRGGPVRHRAGGAARHDRSGGHSIRRAGPRRARRRGCPGARPAARTTHRRRPLALSTASAGQRGRAGSAPQRWSTAAPGKRPCARSASARGASSIG
jgi:hypothetical protein